MSSSSHVPKFGNWDSDNIPYTTFFDNARREKVGMKMNPNDPEENPEAFVLGHEIDSAEQSAFTAHPVPNSNRSNWSSVEKQNNTSVTSESGSSNRSSSGNPKRQKSHDHVETDHSKKNSSESSKSHSTSATRGFRHTGRNSGHQPADDTHRRAASIPKFGAWDEADPRSGESFTVIFNKVKEEKHNPSSKFPIIPAQPVGAYSTDREKQTSPSLASKICCCLFSKES